MAKNRNKPRREHRDKYKNKKSGSGPLTKTGAILVENTQSSNQNRKPKKDRKQRLFRVGKVEEINTLADELFGGKYWCAGTHAKKDENV